MPDEMFTREQYVLLKESQRRGLLSQEQESVLTEAEGRDLTPAASKAEVLGHILSISDPSSQDEGEMQAWSAEWASRVDLANEKVRTEGRRIPLSADSYFQQHKSGADRVSFVQNKFMPGRNKDILSEWQTYNAIEDPEKKLEEAERIGSEVFGLLPPRESLPASFFKLLLQAPAGTRTEGLADTSFAERTKGIGVDLAKPEEQFGLNSAQKRARLIKRVDDELFAKDFANLRSSYEGMLSKESQKWAEETARTGVWTDFAFAILPPEEQQHAIRYARVLRAYDPDGPLKELGRRGLNAALDIGVDSVKFLAERGEDITMHGSFLVQDLFGTEKGADAAALEIVARDQERARTGLELEFKAPKFTPRGTVFKGLSTTIESIPYMLMATPAGPAVALRGTTLVAAMAKDHSDRMIRSGVEPEKAIPLGLMTATANLYIERIVDIPSLGKAGKTTIVKKVQEGFLKKALNVANRGAGLATGETFEEVLQGLTEEVGTQFGLGEADQQKLVAVAAETIEEVLPAMPFFFLGAEGSRALNGLAARPIIDADVAAHDAVDKANEFEQKVAEVEPDLEAFDAKVEEKWRELTTDEQRIAFLGTVNAADPVAANENLKERP